jgi:hypothetical protein
MPALGDIDAGLFPGGVFPDNPFTGAASVIGGVGAYSQGDMGYGLVGGMTYRIQGFGEDATSGPAADGIVIEVSNG